MATRDPFLPPTLDVERGPENQEIAKKDPFLPSRRSEAVPKAAEVKKFDLDTLVNNLLNLPYNVPDSKIPVVAYIQTISERLRMRGYNKLAEKWKIQVSEISNIVSAAASAQNARVKLLQHMIDEQMLPEVHAKAYEARLAEEELRLFKAKKEKDVLEAEYDARIAEAQKKIRRSNKR